MINSRCEKKRQRCDIHLPMRMADGSVVVAGLQGSPNGDFQEYRRFKFEFESCKDIDRSVKYDEGIKRM
jgi:hypothetical protein